MYSCGGSGKKGRGEDYVCSTLYYDVVKCTRKEGCPHCYPACKSPVTLNSYEDALAKKGLQELRQEGDGNCLFRSISLQVSGDSEAHMDVRKRCMDFMVSCMLLCLFEYQLVSVSDSIWF